MGSSSIETVFVKSDLSIRFYNFLSISLLTASYS
jgi:hypothetical protein